VVVSEVMSQNAADFQPSSFCLMLSRVKNGIRFSSVPSYGGLMALQGMSSDLALL